MKKEKIRKETEDKNTVYVRGAESVPEKAAPERAAEERPAYKRPGFKRPPPPPRGPLPEEGESCPRRCRTAAAMVLAAGIALGGFSPATITISQKSTPTA